MFLNRILLSVTALTAATGCATRGHSAQAASEPEPAPTPAPPPTSRPAATSDSAPSWLTVDSAGRTATLTLEVTGSPRGPLINGYRAGEARIIVPLGWTVRWNWRNADSSSAHSLVVMVQREKIPLEGGRPAFSNAMTRAVTTGLPPGGTDQSTFTADEAGWYWLMCGVPSHALQGEWLELRVDPNAKVPGGQIKQRKP
jgi:sulfocyanin SoxE-like protein